MQALSIMVKAKANILNSETQCQLYLAKARNFCFKAKKA